MADKPVRPLIVHSKPPPSPLTDVSGRQDAGFSCYEHVAPKPTDQIVIVDAGHQVVQTIEIEPPARSTRSVPFHVPSARPAAPTIVPNYGPASVESDGSWTVGEPAPRDAVPVGRPVTVMVNAPPAPKPNRRAIVKFVGSRDEPAFGPANKEEQGWVIGGSSGLRIVTADQETGRPRLAAVYIAFMVESYIVDDARPNEVTIFGKVRWYGVPTDRDEEWMNKLLRWHRGERLKELKEALEMFFAFADPRVRMVNRFLGGPATTCEAAAIHGYQCFPGNGSPSTKYMVDMSQTQQGAQLAISFYQEARDYSTLSLRRWWWRLFNHAREALYVLGERYEIGGLPQAQVKDGLSTFERACLAKDVAAAASGAVASLGKIAWRGDTLIEQALLTRQLEPVAATTYTVYEGGDESE